MRDGGRLPEGPGKEGPRGLDRICDEELEEGLFPHVNVKLDIPSVALLKHLDLEKDL